MISALMATQSAPRGPVWAKHAFFGDPKHRLWALVHNGGLERPLCLELKRADGGGLWHDAHHRH